MKNVYEVGLDGSSIKDRLEELSKATAKDIKNCGNTCEIYSRKGYIVKFFSGPIWEGKLVEFVGIFAQRKQEFQ
jgi:hypothetical protein